jgi:prepilin-type N-terminal cleavage/methylation domain-containing protein
MRVREPSGFTIVEVLAVLGLLAILVLAALPQLTVPGTLSASATARQIAVDLRLARQLAIAKRVDHTLEFSPLTAPYTSYTVRNESTLVEEPDFPKALPAGVTASGRRRFTFASGGWGPYDGSGGLGSDGSATVAAGGDTATVQVFWYNGRVKVSP